MPQYVDIDGLRKFKASCDEEYLSADAAVTKLYDELGGATDGAVAQATITEELSKKVDSATMTAELVKKLDSGTKVDEAAHADSSTVAEAATTAVSAETATKATRDGNGNIIASTYVAKVSGKDLSTNDYTTAEKNKLAGIAEGAQVNVIESVKVNGTALTPTNKAVNVDLTGYLPKTGKAADATKADSATTATTADKATQLANSQKVITNLASTAAASFNGTASISAGVTGTLPIGNGGTGQTTAAGVRNALGLGNTTGALPVANGGTGQTNLANVTVGTATKANFPTGFTKNGTGNWGNQTGTELTDWQGSKGGDMQFRETDGGQINVLTDGYFYQNEGTYRCLDTSDPPKLTVGAATKATTADSATKATQDGNGNVITSTYAPRALSSAIEANTWIPFAGRESITDMLQFANYKSGFYSSTVNTNVSEVPSNAWFNVINCKHGNGVGDGNNYGMLIYSPMTAFGNLYWRQLIKQNTWGEEKKIIDSSNLASYMSSNTAGGVAKTLADNNGEADLVWARMAGDDTFRIRVGGAGKSNGYAEIAVGDDGTEPIYVRQYLWDAATSNYFGSIVRTATLLDASGNTSFPGTVSAQNFILSTAASTTEGAMWVVWS